MSMLSDDLASIFADTAVMVSVVFGSQDTTGSLSSQETAEGDAHGGVVVVRRRTVTIAEDALTDLADDETITVDDTDYTIHGTREAGRGKTLVVLA